MDEPPDGGDSASNVSSSVSSHVSSSSDDPLVLIRVHVPDLKVQKCLQFHKDDLVWEVKQQVLTTLPKELSDCQNYGLFSPPSNGKAGKFLDEERPIADYPFCGPIGYFELKYKRRVYKMLKIDEKQIKQLHTRSNLKKMIEYVTNGNHEKVSKLLNKGLDPNFQCQETGETPLSLTAVLKHPAKIIMLLVNGGAILDYRTRDGKTALHRSVERNNYESIKTLLDLGASPNYKDNKGLTPLYYTVTQNADPQLCELLLHDHSMIGTPDLQGWHEVHQAARNGMVQHLEHLLFYGADMNARNASGNTPLHVCAVNDQESCARVLLFRGCDKEAMNYANQTPYQVAVIADNLHLADIIQRHGPDKIVPFREAPRYNPRRRASLAASVVSASLNRTSSDPRLELVLQSASSSGETSCTETSSTTSTMTTCTSSHCEDSEDTCSSVMTDSSGVGTSMNSGGSYESSPCPEAIILTGMTVVCVENHIDYNSPGHLKVYQGDILEVTGVTDCGLIEAVTKKGEHGFVPTSCVQEVKLRHPDSRSATLSSKSRIEGRREMDTKKLCSTPRGQKLFSEPRTVILHKGKKGFGFVLRGAKAASPLMETAPCEDLPSLQYLEEVDKGGVADLVGLRKGDYLLEINGKDVALVSHEHVVTTIRNSGDLVAMTVVSPLSALTPLTDAQTRQCTTLPRKLSAKRAPAPPKRDPTTTLSVGRERAKSLVAGLAEMEALDRVMADYDSEGRSTKSSSVESLPNKQTPKNTQGEQQPKVASIRKSPGAQRANITKLEEMFNRQDGAESPVGPENHSSYPTTPIKSPKVYASVAEMKRQKNKRTGGSTLLKLHHSFHSTPDLHEQTKPPANHQSSNQSEPRTRSHSQSDLNSLNLRNRRQSWIARYAKTDIDSTNRNLIIPKPPPDEPPPPPPVGQIIKVDVSKVHGDYASVTVASVKKDDVMSSFRPGDSAKLYASPETVVNVGIKSEQNTAGDGTLNRSRKYDHMQSTPMRSNSLPPKVKHPPPQTIPQHALPCPNNVTSSESENSGDSCNAIYSTFKNIRSRTVVNKAPDDVSTDSGNSTDKSSFTKEKPLYAKPVLGKTQPIIPDPDYDVSEAEEEPRRPEPQPIVKKTEQPAPKIINKGGANIIYISGGNDSSEQTRSAKTVSQSDDRKEYAPTEFKDDLAKKIAERNSKIVVVNSDQHQVSGKGRKVEIVEVKPGTMKDIVDRRREASGGIETSSAGTVRKNISVFERKQDSKAKVNEHRRSDGVRLQVDSDTSLIKSSHSFPSDLSQEDSSGISSDADNQVDHTQPQELIDPQKPLVTVNAYQQENKEAISAVKVNQKIKMGTGQALLMKNSTMDPPSLRKTVMMGQSAASIGHNPRIMPQQPMHNQRQPARPPVDAGHSVRPKNVHTSAKKAKDERCSDLEKSIEESLEMIKMHVDMLNEPAKVQELFPPPPGFDSSMEAARAQESQAIAPPPEFSDAFHNRRELAHSLPKTKYNTIGRDPMDLAGTRSHNSSPARQLCNGTIPPTSSLKFDTPTSSLLSSVNGPRLRTIQKEFRNKPLQQWSGKDVSDWLESLFMPEYKTNFTEAGITGTRLASLNSEELTDLGVKRVGHRLNMERSLKRYLMKDKDQ